MPNIDPVVLQHLLLGVPHTAISKPRMALGGMVVNGFRV